MEDFKQLSLVIRTNIEYTREVYIWTFQEYKGWLRYGMKYSSNWEFILMNW